MPENTAFLDNLGNLRYYKSVINNANTRGRSSANATASFFVFLPIYSFTDICKYFGRTAKNFMFRYADKAVYE